MEEGFVSDRLKDAAALDFGAALFRRELFERFVRYENFSCIAAK
jgi:hypothetical protein